MTPLLLLIRQHLQQHQRTLHGVFELGIVDLLVGILHRLGMDALAGTRVVLHLDRQIAAHTLHEHLVVD